MVLLWSVLAFAAVLVIAAVVVGREARRLAALPPRPVFDLDEAVEWVADHVPFEVSAVLSHDDVRQILQWNLEYFRARGVSANGGEWSAPAADVVVGDAETVGFVLERAGSAHLEYTPGQVKAVLEAQLAYLEAIGAVGPVRPEEA